MTTPVHAVLDAYRIAVAELPGSAVASRDAEGSVVVVPGDGAWWAAVVDAVAAGAAAVVVAKPGAAPIEALDALASVAGAVPIVVERPLLRADVVTQVGGAVAGLPSPGALAVECHARAHTLAAALRDAIGWARVLAGAPLTRRAEQSWGGRALALLESDRGTAVSVVAAAQPGAPILGRVRVTTIAESRVEVDADLDIVVAITDAGGRRIAPARFESTERVALRRTIAALRGRGQVSDLADLRHDTALAEALLTPSA